MHKKNESIKTWEEQFAKIGISNDMLGEAAIARELYESLYIIVTQMPKDKITSPWHLQLLTGKREYYESYFAQDNVKKYNLAFYSLCSGSTEAYNYLTKFHPELFIELKNLSLKDIACATCLVASKRNTTMLNELINFPDLCLIACISHDWLEGILWINQYHPEAFTTQKNFNDLLDCIYFPHHVAFIHFNLPILNWFKENKNSLFYDKQYNYDHTCVITSDLMRQETTEQLDWVLKNMPALLDRTELFERLMTMPEPNIMIILEQLKGKKPEFFPLDEREFYALGNRALSLTKPKAFNEIVLSTKANLKHFPLILKRDDLKDKLHTLNIVLNDNFCIETFSIQYDYRVITPPNTMDDPIYSEVCHKLQRNKVTKMWPKFALILIGAGDIKSQLYQNGMNLDLIFNFYQHLFSLFDAFGSTPLDDITFVEEQDRTIAMPGF